MTRGPEKMEDRGTADSPVFPVRETRAVETVVLRCLIPGGGRVLLEDKLVVEIWPVRRREELDSDNRVRMGYDSLSIQVLLFVVVYSHSAHCAHLRQPPILLVVS